MFVLNVIIIILMFEQSHNFYVNTFYFVQYGNIILYYNRIWYTKYVICTYTFGKVNNYKYDV